MVYRAEGCPLAAAPPDAPPANEQTNGARDL